MNLFTYSSTEIPTIEAFSPNGIVTLLTMTLRGSQRQKKDGLRCVEGLVIEVCDGKVADSFFRVNSGVIEGG